MLTQDDESKLRDLWTLYTEAWGFLGDHVRPPETEADDNMINLRRTANALDIILRKRKIHVFFFYKQDLQSVLSADEFDLVHRFVKELLGHASL